MSKVNLFNPDTVEAVQRFIEEHLDRLEQIISALRDTGTSEHYTRIQGVINLDANGNGIYQLPIPYGVDYVLERVTIAAPQNGQVVFYLDVQQPSNIVEVIGIGASGVYSDAFSNNIFCPAGAVLIVVFTAAGANGQAAVNLQVKVVPKEPLHTRHLHVLTDQGD